jgi:hypothetical protein
MGWDFKCTKDLLCTVRMALLSNSLLSTYLTKPGGQHPGHDPYGGTFLNAIFYFYGSSSDF